MSFPYKRIAASGILDIYLQFTWHAVKHGGSSSIDVSLVGR
jgi:hypothetical protein